MLSNNRGLDTGFNASLQELERFIGSSFGPLGSVKLVVNGSKQVHASRRCSEMAAEMFGKPGEQGCAANIIQGAMSNLPDGAHTLLAIAAAGLQKVEDETRGSGLLGLSGRSLVHALSAMKGWFLHEFLPEVANSVAIPLPLNCTMQGASQVVRCVLYSMFSCATDQPSARHLSQLLTDLIASHSDSFTGEATTAIATLSDAAQRLKHMRFITKAPGRTTQSSSLTPGVILHASFASVHMPQSLSNVYFIVLKGALEMSSEDASGASVTAATGDDYKMLLLQRQQKIVHRLALLSSAHPDGIGLVITSEKVSDICSFIAAQMGMSIIQLVPKDELESLCCAACLTPLTGLGDLSGYQDMLQAAAGLACTVELLPLDPSRSSLVVKLPQQVSTASTLVVCAPSDWQCQRLTKLMHDGLSIIANYMISLTGECTLLPGGGALELAVASRLMELQDVLRGGGAVPLSLRRLLNGQCGMQVMVQALEVFMACALSVPKGLACPAASAIRTQHPSATGRGAAVLVTMAMSAVKGTPHGGWGLLAPSMASSVHPESHSHRRHACAQEAVQGVEGMAVSKPAAVGVLDLWLLRHDVWQRAIESMVQIMRIETVLPARRLQDNNGAVALVPLKSRRAIRRGGGAHQQANASGTSSGGGSSDEDA